MKHVFWIHSHITFLVSEKVIAYLKLKEEDVVFLTYRDYKIPRNIKKIREFKVGNYTIETREAVEEVENEWSQKLDFDFEFYVPQTTENIIRQIINIPNCKYYNYIEEGMLSYTYKDSFLKIWSHKILKIIGIPKKMRILDYSHKKFKKAYCINDKAFSHCKNKREILPTIFENENTFDKGLLEECNIIIFDGIVAYNVVSLEEFLSLFRVMLDYFNKNNIEKVFYKLHPSQLMAKNKTEVEEIKRVFSSNKNIEFKEITQDVILEELFYLNKKITIYTFVSSLGFYATLLGNKVVSVSNRMNLKISNSIKKDWKQI